MPVALLGREELHELLDVRWGIHVLLDRFDVHAIVRQRLLRVFAVPVGADLERLPGTGEEPLLRRGSSLELDGRRPVPELADAIAQLIEQTP